MINTIKNILRNSTLNHLRRKLILKKQARNLSGKPPEEIFTNIYKNNTWNGKESISGQGSDLSETSILLDKLPAFLKKYNIKTMIDLPCGDYNWMRHLEFNFDQYTGVDIVGDIIEKNNQRFGSDKKIFKQKNCLIDDIGSADLLFCRDLLIHFSQKDVFRFFENLKNADIEYILTTHFLSGENINIVTGQWAPINLCAPPYNFPPPIDYILEETKMYGGQYSKIKAMALWRMADIKIRS
ncbi:MAG TPA: class I SAM-dependent methyltransferase [Alphaproteobacteria bacterium]|nr:class I SAM-dependent methyltransferase [Alphaproteobacteria bacterium]